MSSLQRGQFTAILLSDRNTLETGRLKHEMEVKYSAALTSGLSNPPETGPYKETQLIQKIYHHRTIRGQPFDSPA
jgi:hypothetical protein